LWRAACCWLFGGHCDCGAPPAVTPHAPTCMILACLPLPNSLPNVTPPPPPSQEFLGWCERLFAYLQVLENRLFSEGLHVLGAPPSEGQMAQYLEVRGISGGWWVGVGGRQLLRRVCLKLG
jgi:hypothetical protein